MLRIAMADFAELSKRMIEVAIFAALIYFGLRFLRRTRGSNVLRGLAYLGVAGVASFLFLIQFMGLDRLKQLFEMIVQSVVIALIVVFHPEMRRAIVHIGESKVFARLFRKETKIIQRVSRAVESMSKVKNGPPAEEGDQFDIFAKFIVVPFFVSPTGAVFQGT